MRVLLTRKYYIEENLSSRETTDYLLERIALTIILFF